MLMDAIAKCSSIPVKLFFFELAGIPFKNEMTDLNLH
jgi:hypothetical protein